jgi:hypothetical protein
MDKKQRAIVMADAMLTEAARGAIIQDQVSAGVNMWAYYPTSSFLTCRNVEVPTAIARADISTATSGNI